MKIGLIRCLQTEDMCPAGSCLKVLSIRKGAFVEAPEELELIGVNTCGGCPGKKAVTRAALMVKQGAQAIALSSCISKGSPIGFACPHKDAMLGAIRAKLGPDITVYEYTHD